MWWRQSHSTTRNTTVSQEASAAGRTPHETQRDIETRTKVLALAVALERVVELHALFVFVRAHLLYLVLWHAFSGTNEEVMTLHEFVLFWAH